MPRLVFRTAALRNLDDIAAYIERESKSRAAAEAFIDKLIDYCEHLATLPGLIGSDRSELRPGYRSSVSMWSTSSMGPAIWMLILWLSRTTARN